MIVRLFGDLCPTENNIGLFRAGDTQALLGDVVNLISSADVSFVNLECAVDDEIIKQKKAGPQMVVPEKCLDTILSMGFSAIGLANNHSFDNGLESLEKVSRRILNAGAATIGISTKEHTFLQKRYQLDDVNCTLVCISDYEYNKDENGNGAIVYDPVYTHQAVRFESECCDAVIVVYHTGLENYCYPTLELKKRCHALIDDGASTVICQHSHCIGCYEYYKGKLIVYGQGNFLFDATSRKSWHEGLIIELDISKEGTKSRFIPVICHNGCVRAAVKEEINLILGEFASRSDKVSDEQFLARSFQEFLSEQRWKYCAMLAGGKRYQYILFKCLDMLSKKMPISEGKRIELTSILRSDTQREALLKVLEQETT